MSTQLTPEHIYVPVLGANDLDWWNQTAESEPILASGLQNLYSSLQPSTVPRFESKVQDSRSIDVTLDIELPGNKSITQRRSVLAALAAGGIFVAGSAVLGKIYPDALTKLFTGTQSSPVPGNASSSSNRVATQSVVKSSGATPTQSSAQSYNGVIIGSVTLAINSARAFTNPTDGFRSLLIHLPNGDFIAYESACTHQGVTVSYDPATSMLICPAHGSIFDPATSPLKRVSIQVYTDGTITAAS